MTLMTRYKNRRAEEDYIHLQEHYDSNRYNGNQQQHIEKQQIMNRAHPQHQEEIRTDNYKPGAQKQVV